MTSSGHALTLTEMPKPSAENNGPFTQSPPTLTPKQLVSFYSPAEWEEFIREWAEGLGSIVLPFGNEVLRRAL